MAIPSALQQSACATSHPVIFSDVRTIAILHALPSGVQVMADFILSVVFETIIDWFLLLRRKKKLPE
jgi:hypothetical protein